MIGFLVHLIITPFQFGAFLMPLRLLLNQSRQRSSESSSFTANLIFYLLLKFSVDRPWVPLQKIEKFVGVEQVFSEENFVIPEGATQQLPCYKGKSELDCLGKGESEKGRTINKTFSRDVTKLLHSIFSPFDNYFATHILNQNPFPWSFGL